MEYIRSLAKNMAAIENRSFLICLSVIVLPPALLFSRGSVPLFFLFLAAYCIFLGLTGETLARMMLHAWTRVSPEENTVLTRAFSQAYCIAKQADNAISEQIRLYVYQGSELDGYALGKNTLCLSSAALELPERELTTLFLTKFAQFSHHDSVILIILTAGNLWYLALCVLFKWYICLIGLILMLVMAILGHGFGGFLMNRSFRGLANAIEKAILFFAGGILRLGLRSCRENTFINDAFVCRCGYKAELICFLHNFEPELPQPNTLFGSIDAMKPSRALRISRIQSLPNLSARPDRATGFHIIRR